MPLVVISDEVKIWIALGCSKGFFILTPALALGQPITKCTLVHSIGWVCYIGYTVYGKVISPIPLPIINQSQHRNLVPHAATVREHDDEAPPPPVYGLLRHRPGGGPAQGCHLLRGGGGSLDTDLGGGHPGLLHLHPVRQAAGDEQDHVAAAAAVAAAVVAAAQSVTWPLP